MTDFIISISIIIIIIIIATMVRRELSSRYDGTVPAGSLAQIKDGSTMPPPPALPSRVHRWCTARDGRRTAARRGLIDKHDVGTRHGIAPQPLNLIHYRITRHLLSVPQYTSLSSRLLQLKAEMMPKATEARPLTLL